MIYGKYVGPFHPGCPVTTSEFSDISNKNDLIVHKLLYKIVLQYEQEKTKLETQWFGFAFNLSEKMS